MMVPLHKILVFWSGPIPQGLTLMEKSDPTAAQDYGILEQSSSSPNASMV